MENSITITKYWARLVAAGLAPEDKEVYAENFSTDIQIPHIFNNDIYINLSGLHERLKIPIIQLRKDGKDLFKLEWRMPTKNDIGKKCWFLVGWDAGNRSQGIMLSNFEEKYPIGYAFETNMQPDLSKYCLVADYGQICPTFEDFRRIFSV